MKIKSSSVLTALLLSIPSLAYAGLSLVLTPNAGTQTVNDPLLPKEQGWRVELQLHDWALPNFETNLARVFYLSGTGVSSSLQRGGSLRVFNERDGGICDIPLGGRTNVLIRIQRDPVALRLGCEIWNADGTNYAQVTTPIASIGNWLNPGGLLGSPYTTARLGFLRVFSTILPDGSRPPTTATIGNISNYAFDGNTQDTSGNNHNISYPGASFATSPGQVPVALPRTGGAPNWSTWSSLRAGYPATLDASSSYSMADGSDTVTYRWQQVAGPTTVRWSDRTAAKPVIRGLIFGTYKFRLQVTDAALHTAIGDLETGAVAMDSKGVVIQANPAADILFGPMIALGKNPWPWADEMTLHSAIVRKPYLDTISPPGWGGGVQGTISYEPGRPGQPAETGITVAVQPADNSVTVANASKLDFSSLPAIAIIYPGNAWVPVEEIRVCSVSGNVLNICYDGRAWRGGTWQRVPSPQAWPVGSVVRQLKTTGTGTTFIQDFCPAGPGEEGAVAYNAGSVQVTPGSTTLAGSSTVWEHALTSLRLRISGTHGGQPFVFVAGVLSVDAAGTIKMTRAWPTDADAATSLTYAVLAPSKTATRGWTRPDGTAGKQIADISTCESDTAMYHTDLFVGVSGRQTSQTVGYAQGTWFSDFGPNYYDEVLAHYAGYLRSGHTLFRDNARKVGDYLATSPYFDEGWLGVIPRRLGGTGMFAGAVLDGRTNNWYALRRLAAISIGEPYVGAIKPDCDQDLRETAYELSWLSMAALFDPLDTGNPSESGQKSYWKAQLAKALTRDQGCRGANTSFPSAYWNGSGAYTLTKGSATVKGTGIAPSLCQVANTGTINVTSGSTAATGTGFAPNPKIVISGMKDGKPYLFYSEFTVNSQSSITLAAPYDGDSASYPYQIETDTWWLAFATGVADHANSNTLYACRFVDSTTATLDRPWQGATGTYGAYRNNLVGFGTQPFMLGIKVFAMKLAAQTDSGATAAGYNTLARDAAKWILSTGFDPLTGGLHYARDFTGCEPNLNPRLNCTSALTAYGKEESRTLAAEAQNALRVAYESNPTQQVKDFGDRFYGSQWGKRGGPYFDSIYLTALNTDINWNYKWLGFVFGIGMAHQWPAVRLGGVDALVTASPLVSYNATAVPNAVAARIRVTQPSGAESVFSCAASPCTISVDTRQGAHWYRIAYLDSKGATLLTSDPDLLEVN